MDNLAERLRAAANAERLADHIVLWWNYGQAVSFHAPRHKREVLFWVERPVPSRRLGTLNAKHWDVEFPSSIVGGGGRREGLVLSGYGKQSDAIRAGLIALAEREEAKP